MTRQQLLEQRQQLQQQAQDDAITPRPITPTEVEQASKVVNTRATTTPDFFQLIAALNLLNAAIKQPQYKNELTYNFIKGKASGILKNLVANENKDIEHTISINQREKCAYVTILGFQFSFHNLKPSPEFTQYAESNKNNLEKWAGIRLQRIAPEIFELSTNYKNAH